MAAPRAAMGQAGQNWQPFSDPEPRQQSQGKRPKPCGFTDVLFGFGNSALNEVLEVQGFPTSGIYIHGSATHSQSPGDIDIMIRLSDEEFNALAEEFMESAYHSDRRVDISKGIEKGKLASYYAGTRPTIVQSIHDHLEGDLPKLQVSFIREESTFDLGPVFPINE